MLLNHSQSFKFLKSTNAITDYIVITKNETEKRKIEGDCKIMISYGPVVVQDTAPTLVVPVVGPR